MNPRILHTLKIFKILLFAAAVLILQNSLKRIYDFFFLIIINREWCVCVWCKCCVEMAVCQTISNVSKKHSKYQMNIDEFFFHNTCVFYLYFCLWNSSFRIIMFWSLCVFNPISAFFSFIIHHHYMDRKYMWHTAQCVFDLFRCEKSI